MARGGRRRGYRSVAALPLVHDGPPFGGLAVYAKEPDAFGPAEVELFTEMAGGLSFGIAGHRIRAEREAAEADLAREMAIGNALAEAMHRIPSDATVRQVAQAVCDQLATLPGVDFVSLDAFVGPDQVVVQRRASLLVRSGTASAGPTLALEDTHGGPLTLASRRGHRAGPG